MEISKREASILCNHLFEELRDSADSMDEFRVSEWQTVDTFSGPCSFRSQVERINELHRFAKGTREEQGISINES